MWGWWMGCWLWICVWFFVNVMKLSYLWWFWKRVYWYLWFVMFVVLIFVWLLFMKIGFWDVWLLCLYWIIWLRVLVDKWCKIWIWCVGLRRLLVLCSNFCFCRNLNRYFLMKGGFWWLLLNLVFLWLVYVI